MSDQSIEGLRKAARRVFWEAKNLDKAKTATRCELLNELSAELKDAEGTGYKRGIERVLDHAAAKYGIRAEDHHTLSFADGVRYTLSLLAEDLSIQAFQEKNGDS